LCLQVIDIVNKLEGPPLIRDSMLLIRDQNHAKLGMLRVTWRTNFNDLINFLEDDIWYWLVSFMNENEAQYSIAQQQSDTLRNIKVELFKVREKQYIIVASLHKYIQEWLKGALGVTNNPPWSLIFKKRLWQFKPMVLFII